MGSLSKSVKSLAASGGLIALAFVAGCGSSEGAHASSETADIAPAGTATVASAPMMANVPDADTTARPTPPIATTGALASDTLCEAGETPFFSCEIGAKRVSVCRGVAGAIYRFGTPNKVELTSRSVAFANRGYSGGGESQLTAKNGDYTYTLYDRTVRTSFGESGNDPEFSSGLVIARGGRVISSKTCKGDSSVDADAERTLPGGGFVEH